MYLRKLEERVLAINERGSNFSNLLKNEQEALKNVKKYHDIVIKEADKGGAVVVWERKDYCKEAYNHLNDQQVYEVTESDPLKEVNVLVEKALDPLVNKGYINAANKKYLVVSKPRLGKFYLLYLKFIRVWGMYRDGLLFPIVVRPLKEYQSFWIFIYNL